MKISTFIEMDMAKQAKSRRYAIAFSAIVAIAAASLGLCFRRDFLEAFHWGNLVPALMVLVPLACFFWLYVSSLPLRIKNLVATGTLAIGVVFSFTQPETEVSLAKFAPSGSFWPETIHCFLLGLGLGAIGTLLISTIVWRFFPVANRRWRLFTAMASALFGVAGLTFHCMGPLKTHILIGHWGQAVVIALFSWVLQNFLFALSLKTTFPARAEIKNLSHL